jgi:hypothetical protein
MDAAAERVDMREGIVSLVADLQQRIASGEAVLAN